MKKSIVKRTLLLFLSVLMMFSYLPLALATNAPEVTDKSDYSVESSDSLGSMLAATVEATAGDPNESYFISDMVIVDSKAMVTFQNAAACDLVIAAYDEDTMAMLCSDTLRVAAGADTAELTLTDLTAENMIVKAFLLDNNHQALCKNYTFREYSKDYKDFMSKTVDDFNEEQVINLDKAKDNNFLVLNEETKIVSPTEDANHIIIADFEEDTFVFSDADSAITGLKKGELFYYEMDGSEELIIIRVKSVSVNKENTATVKGEQVALEDAFEYVRIDVDIEDEDFESLDETAAEISAEEKHAAPRNATDIDWEHRFTKSFSLNWPKNEEDSGKEDGKVSFKMHGTGSFSAAAKFKVFLSNKYKEVSFVVTTELKLDFSAEVEIKAVEKKLGEFGIHPITGLFIGINPTFVFTISGKISTNVTFGFDLGGQWDSKEGFTNKCRKLEPDFDGIELEATVFVGIDLKPKAKLISDKVAKAELSGIIGFELKGTISWLKSSDRVVHLCKNCLDGSLAFKMDVKFIVVFAEGQHGWIVSEAKYELPILNLTIPICDFYWSFTYGKFGIGKCPYHLVKVGFVAKDAADGKALENAEINSGTTDDIAVKYNGDSAVVKTDKDGKASYYYPLGTYSATVTCTDYIKKKTDTIKIEYLQEADEFFVNDSAKPTTIICELEKKHTVTGTVVDYANNIALSGVTVSAGRVSDSNPAITTTDENGKFTLQLDSGNYQFSFSLDGYLTQQKSVFIEKETEMSTIQLLKSASDAVYNPENQHYYKRYDIGGYTWHQAEEYCEKNGGHLATITSEQEQKFVADLVSAGDKNLYWLGGSDIDLDGNWEWITNEPWTCSYWTEGNPDNDGGDQMYLQMFRIWTLGFWNDQNEKEPVTDFAWNFQLKYVGFVCEWENAASLNNNSMNPPKRSLQKKTIDFKRTQTVEGIALRNEISSDNTVCCSNAVKGDEYLLLVVKDVSAEKLLTTDNLLYIDQQTAESETVTFTYVPREAVPGAVATIYGPDKDSHVHRYVAKVTKEPTCTEQGETTYTCPCGDSYTEAIPANGHTMTKTEAKAPTCVKAGNAEYYTCSVCNKIFSDEKGEMEISETALSATGEHSYGEWTVTKAATVESEGEETRTCSVCGKKDTRAIPKLTPETPDYKKGDVDGDGEISSGDARLALRASVQLEKYEAGSAKFLAADVDGNGEIEASDARTILRVSVKLETFA